MRAKSGTNDSTLEKARAEATSPRRSLCALRTARRRKARARCARLAPWCTASAIGASGVSAVTGRSGGAPERRETEAAARASPVGPGAGEMIAEGALAIEMGANATDLKLTIHPHPTLTETMMESAEVFFGQATHVFRPKRG